MSTQKRRPRAATGERSNAQRSNKSAARAVQGRGANVLARTRDPIVLIGVALIVFALIWSYSATAEEMVATVVEPVTSEAVEEESEGFQSRFAKAFSYLKSGDGSAIAVETDSSIDDRLAAIEATEADLAAEEARLAELMDEVEYLRGEAELESTELNQVRTDLLNCVTAAMEGQ